jgi:predicted permease
MQHTPSNPRTRDARLLRELEFHIDEMVRAYMAGGMPAHEARRRARLEFGGLDQITEECREVRRGARLRDFWRDLLHGGRLLRRAPGFAAVAIATLAVGIGANTAVFSLVHTLLLASLPVDHPEQLVVVSHSSLERSGGTGFPYQFFHALDADRQVLDGVLSRGGSERVTVGADAGGEPAIGELVSGSFFDVLGVKPAIGRLFTRGDDLVPGGHPVVVLSHPYWQRGFGGDAAIVGRTVMISGHPMTVIGVTPAGFAGLDPGQRVDLRVPLAMQAEVRGGRTPATGQRRTAWELQIVARLKRGTSLEQAQQVIGAALTNFAQAEGTIAPERVMLRPAATGFGRTRAQFETALWVLMSITIALLAIACVNLAMLHMARASARLHELTVRTALGAGLGRLVRQLLAESVLLAMCGAVLGIVVAYLGATWLGRLASGNGSNLLLESRPHVAILVFHVSIAVLAGTLCGLGPVLRLRRSMSASGRQGSGDGLSTARYGLVTAQVALSVVVLVGAGLFVQTIGALRSTDLGFRSDRLLLIALDPKTAGAGDSEVIPFYRGVRERLLAVPGITGVTFSTVRALSNSAWSAAVSVEGRSIDPSARAYRNAVGPGYFRTLGTPVLSGRDFTEADDSSAPRVAVVNESFARAYLGEQNPLGRKIGVDRAEYTIVGVARNTRHVHVRDTPAPTWYVPYEQRPGLKHLDLMVRTAGDPEGILPSVRTAIAAVDSRVALFEARSQIAQIDDMLLTERMLATLATIFASLAATLAALGLHGPLAFLVSQRRCEMALRIALGAPTLAVVRAIGGNVWRSVGAGMVGGVLAAMALGRYAHTIVYGVSPTDGTTLTGAVAVMTVVAVCGSLLPLVRATRIDPNTVLREQPR